MPKHISARSKKQTKITELDALDSRKRALHHYRKPSKAEKNFDYLMEGKETRKRIDSKDSCRVLALIGEYWQLQRMIDNINVDAQVQRMYIDQQNDLLDDIEVIYNKYLPKKNEKDK